LHDKFGCQRAAGLAKKAGSRGLILHWDWGKSVLRSAKIIALGILALAVWGYPPAAAGCDVISATHSADNKAEALTMSRALAAQSANELRRSRGWRYVSMSAYRVKPDPFWKSVRPVVPKDVIYGTFVTAKTYTTCFTGMVVPYVCTSGSKVCGN
jgi:hypothetical protein